MKLRPAEHPQYVHPKDDNQDQKYRIHAAAPLFLRQNSTPATAPQLTATPRYAPEEAPAMVIHPPNRPNLPSMTL